MKMLCLRNHDTILFFIKTIAADFMKFINGYLVSGIIGSVLYAEPRLTCTACMRGLIFILYSWNFYATVLARRKIIINVQLKSSNLYYNK